MIVIEKLPSLTAVALNLENAAEFLQRDMGVFVDTETTNGEKHALPTRCWLPEKQYMFPDVIQGKPNRLFYIENTWKCVIALGISWSHRSQVAFLKCCVTTVACTEFIMTYECKKI